MPRKKAHPLTKSARNDGFSNVITGLGTSYDKRLGATACPVTSLTTLECANLFHGNDIAKRLAEKPAVESFRQGIEICVTDDPDRSAEMQQLVEELDLLSHMTWTKTLANAFGGAALVIGADDGQDAAVPLNLKRVRGKGVKFLTTYDKSELTVDKRYDTLERYGEPEFYRLISNSVVGGTNGRRIHESRIIHLEGERTTRQWSIQYGEGWGASVYQHTLGILRGYDNAWDSAEILMQDFAQAVYKIKGLAELLSEGGESAVIARLRTIDASRSILRAVLVDAEQEDFSRQQTPMAGLPELLDRWLYRVAAAANMPVTVLFGMSPGGMNATGESDMRVWYDTVKSKQDSLRPAMEKLLTILFATTADGEPAEWSFKWCPLWQPSQTETQQARYLQAQTDQIYANIDGGLTGEEIVQSRFGSPEGYSFETHLDEAARQMMATHEQTMLESGMASAQAATDQSTQPEAATGAEPA